MSRFSKLKRAAIATAAGVGLTFAAATGANALTFNPNPIHDGDTVTVTSTTAGLPQGDYRVSLCTTERYGLFRVPACAPSKPATLNSKGQAVAHFTAQRFDNPNAHANTILVAQPDTFDCATAGACEILLVHHKSGFRNKETIEREPITVLP